MYISRYFLQSLTIIILLLLASCKHEPMLPPLPADVSYSKDIAPIMKTYCAYSGCHISGNYSNFPLEKYSDLMDYGGVFPYKPQESNFYDVIGRNYMPLGDTLSTADKELVYTWIKKGALDN